MAVKKDFQTSVFSEWFYILVFSSHKAIVLLQNTWNIAHESYGLLSFTYLELDRPSPHLLLLFRNIYFCDTLEKEIKVMFGATWGRVNEERLFFFLFIFL